MTYRGSRSSSLKSLLLGIWAHLSRLRRTQFALLLIIMLVSGAAELISLGAVFPFLAALTEPERIWQYPILIQIANRFQINSPEQLIIPATVAFAASTVLASAIRLSNLWLNSRYAAAVGSELSCEVYKRNLHQSYEYHLQSNSASIINSATTQIGLTIGALNALLRLITSSIIAIGLATGLFLIDIRIALFSIALFGGAYGIVAIVVRRQLRLNSREIAASSTQQVKALQEGLGGIRDVLLGGHQPTYVEIYRKSDRILRILQAQNVFLSSFPRYLLEALGVLFICFLGSFLLIRTGSKSSVIPLLGSFALGAQRLLPSLQQLYASWSVLKGYSYGIEAVLELLNLPLKQDSFYKETLSFNREIRIDNVCFTYAGHKKEVLKEINLSIVRGQCIGIIGTTGSGKSTMVDILMGLLSPSSGRLIVDDIVVNDPQFPGRLASWQSFIAHVPQNIFLADCSIAENIAFGVPHSDIDMRRVKLAAIQAQIASYIEDSPMGYDSFVGERGIRLSGGQKQRLGIARALYTDAKILILDEATSALDSNTESAVMQSIRMLDKELTVVMVAHRLSTLSNCDAIVQLRDGSVEKILTPHSLLDNKSI